MSQVLVYYSNRVKKERHEHLKWDQGSKLWHKFRIWENYSLISTAEQYYLNMTWETSSRHTTSNQIRIKKS